MRAVWLKAGTGLDRIDKRFASYAAQATEVGMPFGCAWWPKPHLGKPEEQADVFAYVINQTAWTIPPYPDFEADDDSAHLTPTQRTDFLRRFYARLRAHCDALPRAELNEAQRIPWIYTLGKSVQGGWWDNNVGGVWEGIPFRLARYISTAMPAAAASTWVSFIKGSPRVPVEPWAAWQFSAEPNGLGKALLGSDCMSTHASLNLIKADVWAALFPGG